MTIQEKLAALPPMPAANWGDAQDIDSRLPVLLNYAVGERKALLARNALLCEALREGVRDGMTVADRANWKVNARAVLSACEVQP